MSAVKEGAVLHEVNSPTAATRANPLFGTSGVMTYRVTMQGNNGMLSVDVDSDSGDGAAEAAHKIHHGCKVLHIEPAPQAKAA